MTVIETLQERNAAFAAHRFSAGLSLMPTLQTMIVGCVDPRVDPAHVLGLQLGEAIVIRNIGGRITPGTLQTMALLAMIPRLEGAATVPGLNLVVLHHTDCGITRLAKVPDVLASYFGVASDDLDGKAVSDPRSAVGVDIAVLKATPSFRGGIVVSGFVYDVATGRLETVVAPAPLSAEQPGA
jgi:carbonic anhydrase